MTLTITLIIIIITVIVSVSAFSNEKILNDLVFYPPAVTNNKQWYRFLTCGLVHADFMHLAFNMYALYVFGARSAIGSPSVEDEFMRIFQEKGKLIYLLMYVSALVVCLLPTYSKHKTDSSYRSLGASGAVSAVIFAYIILSPLNKLNLMFIPIGIPGFIFGFLYLFVSSLLDKRGGGNINHSAHIWGALYGIAFLIIASYLFSDERVLANFVEKISRWSSSF
jgi:membrane associated rhomboid family serine protease